MKQTFILIYAIDLGKKSKILRIYCEHFLLGQPSLAMLILGMELVNLVAPLVKYCVNHAFNPIQERGEGDFPLIGQ